MDKSTLNKLKNIEERFFEIEKLMADQNNASDIQMITKLAKEHSELKKVVNLYQDINEKSSQMLDLKQIVKEENDNELIELAKEDISDLEKEIETLSTDLQEQLIPKDVEIKLMQLLKSGLELVGMRQVFLLEKFFECIKGIQSYKTGLSNWLT